MLGVVNDFNMSLPDQEKAPFSISNWNGTFNDDPKPIDTARDTLKEETDTFCMIPDAL